MSTKAVAQDLRFTLEIIARTNGIMRQPGRHNRYDRRSAASPRPSSRPPQELTIDFDGGNRSSDASPVVAARGLRTRLVGCGARSSWWGLGTVAGLIGGQAAIVLGMDRRLAGISVGSRNRAHLPRPRGERARWGILPSTSRLDRPLRGRLFDSTSTSGAASGTVVGAMSVTMSPSSSASTPPQGSATGWLACQRGARSASTRAVAARLPMRRQACW